MASVNALMVKYNKTVLFLSVEPQTSAGKLRTAILRALVESRQPVDEQLGRPFEEATEDDIAVYRGAPSQENHSYELIAPDATVSELGLGNMDAVYVGFRAAGQGAWLLTDTPAQPVVHPPLDDDEDE